jgi:hypothetical protein
MASLLRAGADLRALVASVRSAIRPGEPADLVLCGADPHDGDTSTLRTMPVLATLLGGRITHLE